MSPSPLLVGLLGVLAGAIIVAICHCIIVFCNSDGRQSSTGRNDSGWRPEDDPAVRVTVQSKYSKEELCAVCLGEFRMGERVRVLSECAHIFHVSCINKWLQNHPSCPLCRATTIPPSALDFDAVEINVVPTLDQNVE